MQSLPASAMPQRDDGIGLDSLETLLHSVGPVDQDSVDLRPVAEAEVHPNVACAEIARIGVNAAPQGALPTAKDGDQGAHSEAIRPGDPGLGRRHL